MVNNRRKIIFSSVIIITFFLSSIAMSQIIAESSTTIEQDNTVNNMNIGLDTYTPIDTAPLNIEEAVKLSPMFTPDNALDIHAAWIKRANSTIDLQNQYIRKFNESSWEADENPVVQELIAAADRGLTIRLILRDNADSDLAADFFNTLGVNVEARYMGDSTTSPDNSWVSNNHNKVVILDSKVTLVSSINFGDAFLENREAGMVVQSETVSQYYLKFFEEDWADGENSVSIKANHLTLQNSNDIIETPKLTQGDSFTNIPRTNFSGIYNISAFVNPDNSDEHILKYLKSAKQSIYVSMYTISRADMVDILVNLKKNNPTIDIQVLISNRRVGDDENVDTQASALKLVENLIPVYNSTKELRYYHNKYWIIDQKHTFIYSGNWSPRSLTPVEASYPSGDVNRDMGLAVHDASDIADWVKAEVWDKDVDAAEAYELPVGINQNSFTQSEVVSGTVKLSATVNALTNPTVSYSFGAEVVSDVALTNDGFEIDFDTTTLANGITTFKVEATDTNGVSYEDEVKVNIANYPDTDNFRFLITEIHANPDVVDDTEGEFIELTNSFPFALLIEGWQAGDDNDLYIFPKDFEIAAYSSIIIARDSAGFSSAFSITADIQLSFSLSNGGDLVQLLDQDGNYVDVVAYGDETAADGSETVSADYEAGESISRSLLHVDTNSASDFVFEAPSPKDTVPTVSLGEIVSDVPIDFPNGVWLTLVVLCVIPILRRKR